MELFVFDLDLTLWNAGETFCSETNPPYYWENKKLLDQEGRWIRLFPETISILKSLKKKGKTIVAASRTTQPEWSKTLLSLLKIDIYFDHTEIYPGSKINHFNNIQFHYNVPFKQMAFFDDEKRNICDVEKLGVNCFHVENGINTQHISQALASLK